MWIEPDDCNAEIGKELVSLRLKRKSTRSTKEIYTTAEIRSRLEICDGFFARMVGMSMDGEMVWVDSIASNGAVTVERCGPSPKNSTFDYLAQNLKSL